MSPESRSISYYDLWCLLHL